MSRMIYIRVPNRERHDIFIMTTSESIFAGIRKPLSHVAYSIILPDMIKGPLISLDETKDEITLGIRVLDDPAWREKLLPPCPDYNIHFPWPPLDDEGNEAICPESFWDQMAGTPEKLDIQEAHFRLHTVNLLREIAFPDCRVFDPTCSTGTFLASVKQKLPRLNYFAADRAEKMVLKARQQLPQVVQSDFMQSCDRDRYDIIFCRFANHEVIRHDQAAPVIDKLITLLNKKGYLIIFGHTPVNCDVKNHVRGKNIALKMTSGYSERSAGFFQYYLLQTL